MPTAPKKTWGGQWVPQGSFFVATFVTGGQAIAPKCPTFLSCDTLPPIMKTFSIILFTYLLFLGCSDTNHKTNDEIISKSIKLNELNTSFLRNQIESAYYENRSKVEPFYLKSIKATELLNDFNSSKELQDEKLIFAKYNQIKDSLIYILEQLEYDNTVDSFLTQNQSPDSEYVILKADILLIESLVQHIVYSFINVSTDKILPYSIQFENFYSNDLDTISISMSNKLYQTGGIVEFKIDSVLKNEVLIDSAYYNKRISHEFARISIIDSAIGTYKIFGDVIFISDGGIIKNRQNLKYTLKKGK